MQSMTGFARAERAAAFGTLVIELRSVNQRYLEPNFRLPETFRFLEPAMREQLRGAINRGKLDVSLQFQPQINREQLQVDAELVAQYVRAAEQVQALISEPAALKATDFLFRPGVLIERAASREQLEAEAMSLFAQALQELGAARAREGAQLAAIIQDRADQMAVLAKQVRELVPAIVKAQQQKLRDRLAELNAELNHDRLEQELVYIAQRMDVEEEVDRLNTHLQEVARLMKSKGPIGRKLDFLMQELNREANTLGSKSMAVATTQIAVDLKVLIEQMREQVQNIE